MVLKLSKLLSGNGKWLEQQSNSILSAATIISIANVISLFAGLLRERLLIGTFFTSESSKLAYEAFKVAFQIPNTMFQIVILGALSATLVPIFTQLKKSDEKKAFKMSSVIFNYLVLVFVILSVAVYIWAEPLTHLRTGTEFTPEQIQIVINLTRVMLISQLFFAISNFLSGILQSYQRFVIPAFAPILYNIGILLGVYLFADQFGIYSAGIGVVIGAFIHMIIQVPLVFKLGFRYKLSFDLSIPGVKNFLKLSPPRTLALAISEIRKLFLGFFATSLGNLSFLVMDYGLTLMTIPIRFFGVAIGQAALPFLSDEAEEKDQKKFRKLLLQSLHQISFFSLPASALLLILRVPIVRLVYGTANFPWETTITVGKVLAILSISIVAQALVHLLIRAFYALKDTRTPLIVTTIDGISYLILCYVLIFTFHFGVLGIAVANTITGFLEFLILLLLLNRKLKGVASWDFWYPQMKMTAAAFLMAVFLYLPFKFLDELVFDTTRTIELIGLTVTTGTIALLVYIYFAVLFQIKELYIFVKLFEKFGGWKKNIARSEIVDNPLENEEI